MRSIGAVILAAGESSRFGRSKQLVPFRGQSLLRRIVAAATAADCQPVTVVVGSNREAIKGELTQTTALVVENEDWPSGIGTSIHAGVRTLIEKTPKIDAVVLLTCDQPFVDEQTIKSLIALSEKTDKAIVASAYAGTLGVPALFDRSCFPELLALDDGNGAKSVIWSNRNRVTEFPFPQGKIDIDTAQDYERVVANP